MQKHLSEMTIDEVLRPEGHDCECGMHHACGLKYLKVGKGVVTYLPEALEAIGVKYPFVVMDRNTQAAAGEAVENVLKDIPHQTWVFPTSERMEPDEYTVGGLAMAFDPACDVIIAVGSGVINDTCKVVAHIAKVPSVVVGTAPSMDGYGSNSSAMIRDHVKVTMNNACPQAIIADTNLLKTAPDIMLQAGLGDMLAKYVSVCEWRISNIVYGDPYCEEVAGLVRASLAKIVAHADGLMKRDDDAIAAVVEGLILSGVAMAFVGFSRPASGLEHYFSHVWEMQALRNGTPSDLHGIQVGVGTMLCLHLYESLLPADFRPDAEKAKRYVAEFSHEKWRADMERIFDSVAPNIIAIEKEAGKNTVEKHAIRLQRTVDNWDTIRAIIDAELPPRAEVEALMRRCGMPITPGDLHLGVKETQDAFIGSRDIRDKYVSSSMFWDLGMMDEAVAALADWVN